MDGNDSDEYQPAQQETTTTTTSVTNRRSRRLAEKRKQKHNPYDSESESESPENGFMDIPENFYEDDDDADDVLEQVVSRSKHDHEIRPWWFYASVGCVAFVIVWTVALSWVYYFTKTTTGSGSLLWTLPLGASFQTIGAAVLIWCWARSDDYTVKEGVLLTFFSTFTVVLLYFLMIRWYLISIWELPSTALQLDTETIRSLSDEARVIETAIVRILAPIIQWIQDSPLHHDWWMNKLTLYLRTWMEFD